MERCQFPFLTIVISQSLSNLYQARVPHSGANVHVSIITVSCRTPLTDRTCISNDADCLSKQGIQDIHISYWDWNTKVFNLLAWGLFSFVLFCFSAAGECYLIQHLVQWFPSFCLQNVFESTEWDL